MTRILPRILRASLLLFLAFCVGAAAFNADPYLVQRVFHVYMTWAAIVSGSFVLGTIIMGLTKRDGD